MCGFLAVVSSVLLPTRAAAQDDHFIGASYLITIRDAQTGAFASRGVITLHADHTMSGIDSAQGGPAFFFSSQLGSWKLDAARNGLVARTIDFNFPQGAGMARLDYTIRFGDQGTRVSGTITLRIFTLEEDPLDAGGTVVGVFTFTGVVILP